jgi:protein-S-isoprenylcysteine O-methyltransferase Ste14
MRMNIIKAKGTFLTVAIFYSIVVFEFFYMASPFAAYFYSVYKPGLIFLDKFPEISWLTGFFLPHLVESTQSWLINSLNMIAGILVIFGMFVFLISAFQVYYAKIFRKGAVIKGFYKYVRHPQYTAFAICSFGLLLFWPRYLALIMYISLLFAYDLLAKAEEKECSRKFGNPYNEYLKRTHRFLPIKIPGLIQKKASLNSNIRKVLFTILLYVFTLIGAIYFAKMIKSFSISKLHATESLNAVTISILKNSKHEIQEMYDLVMADSIINKEVNSKLTNEKMINYLLPADMYISEIPMKKPLIETCHVYGASYDNSKYKLIFTRAIFPQTSQITSEINILKRTLRTEPILEVWIDLKSSKIIKTILLLGTQRYENIPEPVF